MENSSGLMLAAKIIKARSQKEKVCRDQIFISGRNANVTHDFHCSKTHWIIFLNK